MSDKIIITRNQLAKFLPTPEAVKAFENLFKLATQLTPADIATLTALAQENNIDANLGVSLAQSALDSLKKISDTLEMLIVIPDQSIKVNEDIITLNHEHMIDYQLNNPSVLSNETFDNFIPPISLGDISSQNKDRVDIKGGTVIAKLTNNDTVAITTSQTLTNNAAASLATITNSPIVGDPTKWISINDNGTIRYIPTWS